jgi:CheY-like chemotaxis protein
MNLAVNARDAMPDGGKLTIEAENFLVDSSYARLHLEAAEGDYLLITVTDTGVGIPPEIIDRIFEPFFTTKEIGRGTGLGLSTVIGIIKSHGGFIDVTSQTRGQRGTTVKIFIPASKTAASTTAENDEFPQGNGELILVVDDESSMLEVTKATLETYNYQVLTADNGIEAIALYVRHQQNVSLVIMDIMMPGMDGKTAIRTLKQINPELEIIAVSGLITSQEILVGLDGDVTAFMSKPYGNDELLIKVREVVSRQIHRDR